MSRLVIEHNYLMQMGMYLSKFKYTPSTKVANFRCPICGDSEKNENKCRGFIFLDQNKRDTNINVIIVVLIIHFFIS